MASEKRNIFRDCEEADKDIKSGPHAWIQWKGTNVCEDINCSCGEMTHVDAEFAYYVQCGACGALWAMCANIRMVPVTLAEVRESGAHESVMVTSRRGEE